LEQKITALEKECLTLKRLEKKRRETQEKFKALYDRRLLCIYAHDFQGNFLDANMAALNLLGFRREEIHSLNFASLIDDDQLPKALEELKEIRQTGFQKNFMEFKLRKKDGDHVWVETDSSLIYRDGEPYAILGVARDITDRKNAEKALRESEEKFRTVAEQSPNMIFINKKGRIVYANGKCEEVMKYRRDEFYAPDFDFMTLIAPESSELIISNFKKHLRGEEIAPYEYSLMDKNGKKIEVIITTKLIHYEDESAILGIVTDITQRKQAEQEKKRLEVQLQQAQKMQAIGTLAGGIAHDFNNLLMGIQGRITLMMLETIAEHPFFEHLQEIENYIRSGAQLTKQLLGFARRGKYEVKPTDLNHLVTKSIQMFGRTRKEITIQTDFQEKIRTVEVDRSQIEQVLLNIYVNAWQAMPGGGKLKIQIENITLDENFVGPHKVNAGNYVKVSITDTGIGMDESILKRVFDPFFTTKEKGRGTGLGLASAYGIIKNHDGIITARSKKGEGATFNLYLPASKKSTEEDRRHELEIAAGSETILLVDDEQMIIDVGQMLLNKLGYRVIATRDGKEAIEIYQQHKDEIAVVVLDMVMPGMGGEEVYANIKKINPDVKVLLSSGYSLNGQATELLMRGCNGFIQKPFGMQALSKKIRGVLD